jgi:hypothetical protein
MNPDPEHLGHVEATRHVESLASVGERVMRKKEQQPRKKQQHPPRNQRRQIDDQLEEELHELEEQQGSPDQDPEEHIDFHA